MAATGGHDWLLRHKGLGMTLIGYGFSRDRVTLAVDGAATYVNDDPPPPTGYTRWVTSPCTKMRILADGSPLAWALVGGLQDFGPFGQWIDSASFESWTDLGNQCQEKVAELNQETVSSGRAAGLSREDREIMRSRVVVAGFVEDKADVVVVENRWIRASDVGQRYHFVGPHFVTSVAAWQAVKAFNPEMSQSNPKTMRTFMESMCESLPFIGSPVQVVEITKHGCKDA